MVVLVVTVLIVLYALSLFTGMADLWDLRTLILVVIMLSLIQVSLFGLLIYRHQKVLEWFQDHIHLDPHHKPPEVLGDILDTKDGDD